MSLAALNVSLLLEPPGPETTLDLPAVFAGRPVELEIGSGKGGFLLAASQARPDHGFLGVEWANKYARLVADRLARNGVCNARVLRSDASMLVARNLAPACLDGVHIYHPDPWPKARHHKRRLIQERFLLSLARAMRPGALLRLQTDHDGYFSWMEERLALPSVQAVLERLSQPADLGEAVQRELDEADAEAPEETDEPAEALGRSPLAEPTPGTNFERKYRERGSTIHRAVLRRR